MLKQIQLKISKIKYFGDSVSDDVRIEVECLDKFVGEIAPQSSAERLRWSEEDIGFSQCARRA